jgi:dipeptidyl aminopeptidase/acylaminoacyl peptidase
LSSKGILAAAVIVLGLQEPKPWRIVFQTGTDGAWTQSKSAKADGTDVREVADDPGPLNGRSPDGSKRAYISTQDGDAEIWVSEADGKNPRRLTDNKAIDNFPGWTPDGRRIVFASTRSGTWQIWIMEADGSNPNQLTQHADGAWMPQVSPAGDRISYLERHSERSKLPPSTLRTVDLVGRDSKVLIEKTQMLGHAWSPKGETLAVSLVGEVRILDLLGKPVKSFDLKSVHKDLGAHAAYDVIWRPDGGALACAIRFLGGRTGGAKLFGDDQIFILPMEGKPVVIEAGGPASPVRWIR